MIRLRTISRTSALALIASLAFAGCAGGMGTSVMQAIPTAARTAKASFTIHWPAHPIHSLAHTARPLFISPSALAVIVEVNPNAQTPGPITFANANGAATTTVDVDAPVGTDEFVFTLWDERQPAGETQPVGNLLGQADVPSQSILAGRLNVVNATIGGITDHIAAAPVANQPFVRADSAGGYDLVGDQPATFGATAYDAGNNVIVAPGAPTLSFAASSGSSAYLAVSPVANNPNQFTVVTIAAKPTTGSAGVNVTASDAGVLHTNTTNLSLWIRSAVYVSYKNGRGSKIGAYDDQGHMLALPSTAFTGLDAPAGLVYVPSVKRLYIADTGSGKIVAFDAAGNPASGFTAPSVAGVRGLAYDPQSNVMYATTHAKTLAFNLNGSAKSLSATAFSQTATPDGIAYVGEDINGSPDDEIAVANDTTLALDYYKANGTFLRSDILTKPPTGAPISALAWNANVYAQPVFAAGGTAGSGFALTEATGGYLLQSMTSASTAFGGMAFASTVVHSATPLGATQDECYIVQTQANSVQGYIMSPNGSTNFSLPDVLIVTPPSSGLSNPLGIATAL